MISNSTPAPWTKNIQPARDRLQSRLLVWIVAPILCALALDTVRQFIGAGEYARADLTKALAISLIFALVAWCLKAATPLAAWCGGTICLLITESWQRLFVLDLQHGEFQPSISHSTLTPLILLFLLTFAATRLGRGKRNSAGLGESRSGRNAAQVVANLGIAALLGQHWSLYLFAWIGYSTTMAGQVSSVAGYSVIFLVPMLAALAEATADTVSSEIGQAFGGTPFMLTTLRRVPPGTDGAISLYGTLAGIAAAAVIAATGAPAMGMSFAECVVAFAAGVCGLFFDSLLGATVERRGYIGNDVVNFASTAFAAAIVFALTPLSMFFYC